MMNQNNDNKNTKKSPSSFFNDKRFLLLFSFICAFCLWMWVSIEKSPETEDVIFDVPVNIELKNSVPEKLGLSIFGNSDFKINVTVKGKKYITSSLKPDDIVAVANTNYVDGSGVHSLQIKVTPKDDNGDYEIVTYSANSIEVYFDASKEIELPLEGKIESKLSSVVPKDCKAGDIVFSKDTVRIKGPASEVNKITNIQAIVSVDKVLEKTTSFDPNFKIITEDGSSPEYVIVENGNNGITATVPVLKDVILPTKIEFRNAPSYFINNPLLYTVEPASVKVAIPVDMIETTTHFVVDTIDFADLSTSVNTFTVEAKSINSPFSIVNAENLTFKVKIDASDMVSKSVVIPASQISVINSRDDYIVDLGNNKDITVKLIGIENKLDNVSIDNLSIVVDTSGQEISDETSVLTGYVLVTGDYPCWAVGNYDVKVTVEPLG